MVIKNKKWSFLAYALLFLAIGLISLWPQKAAATTGVPQLISFEGKIVHGDGTNITDGTYNMEFDIYTGCTNEPASNAGCTVAWTEDWLVHNTQGVAFTSGTYAVNLGSITSLSSLNFNSYPLYISVDIGNTTNVASTCAGSTNFNANCGGDGVMNPYIELTSAPYAINSGELGGLTASQFGQLAANNTWTGTNTVQPSVSTTAFSVMNASNADFTVDTSGNNVIVGKAGAQTAVLELANATGTNVVGLQAGASTAAYTLTLPTTAPSTNQCLESGPSTANSLVFGSCTLGATYLAKNSADTSSAAVTTGNFLYAFTNSSSAVTSGVLSLNNGSNTNDTLYVTTSGNPASGQALIVANETNGAPSGNLIDLQVSATSKFKVDVGGNVTAVGTTGLTLSGASAGITLSGGGTNTIASTGTNANLTLNANGSGTATLDTNTAGSGTVAIGANAATTNIGGGTANETINIGNSTGNDTVRINNTTTGTNTLQVGSTSNGSAVNEYVNATGMLVQSIANSASAFQIQNSSGAQLLAADTADGNLEVTGNIDTPFGGFGRYQNLLTYSQQLDNAVWVKNSPTVTANAAIAPDGTTTAELVTVNTGTDVIYQQVSVAASTTYTFSWWAKLGTLNPAKYRIYDVTNATNIVAATSYGTTNWQRYSITFTTASNTAAIRVQPIANPGGTGTAYLWGTQLEQNNTMGTYVETSAAAASSVNQGLVVNSAGGSLFNGNLTVETSSGAALFAANTSSNVVSIQASSATAAVLDINNSDGTTAIEVRSGGPASSNNTFVGVSAGMNDSGINNTAFGKQALQGNTSGFENTAVGLEALSSNSTGNNNSAFGYFAGLYTSGSGNTAIGNQALSAVSNSGGFNTAIGDLALSSDTTGANNTAIGMQSLVRVTSGSYNTGLGYYAGNSDSGGNFTTTATVQYATAIGAYAQVQASDTIALGSVDTPTQIIIGSTQGFNSTNLFGVSPVIYNSGAVNASQSTTTVTASSGVFQPSMIGMQLIFANGVSEYITNVGSVNSTTATVGTSQTVSSQAFRVHVGGLQVTNNGTAYIQATSTNAFQVQNAAGTATLTVDTTNNQIIVGNGGNTVTVSSSGVSAAGSARHTKSITLTAEYAGAVLDCGASSCPANDIGTMTAGYDYTQKENYYQWTTGQSSNQAYDVVAQVPLPADWSAWAASSPVSIDVQTSDTTNGTVTATIQGTNGTADGSCNGVTLYHASTSWNTDTTDCTVGGSGATYSAGGTMTIRLHIQAFTSGTTKVGNITLKYLSSF